MAGKKGSRDPLSTSPTYAAAIRARIQSGVIVDRLEKHVLGKVEMTATQVTAALGLLRKCVPDLSENKTELETGERLTDVLRSLRRHATCQEIGAGADGRTEARHVVQ